MAGDVSFAESIETARRSLGWSFEVVEYRTGYSAEFLKRVHRGKPFPEVEEKLVKAYVNGLAEAASDSVLTPNNGKHTKSRFVRVFKGVVQRLQLRLQDVVTLCEKASSLTVVHVPNRDQVAVDDLKGWDAVLQSLATDILRRPIWLDLPRDMPPGRSTHPKQDVAEVVIECDYCYDRHVDPPRSSGANVPRAVTTWL